MQHDQGREGLLCAQLLGDAPHRCPRRKTEHERLSLSGHGERIIMLCREVPL